MVSESCGFVGRCLQSCNTSPHVRRGNLWSRLSIVPVAVSPLHVLEKRLDFGVGVGDRGEKAQVSAVKGGNTLTWSRTRSKSRFGPPCRIGITVDCECVYEDAGQETDVTVLGRNFFNMGKSLDNAGRRPFRWERNRGCLKRFNTCDSPRAAEPCIHFINS